MRAESHFVSPEELMAYVDGEVGNTRGAEIGAHAGRCRECQERIAEFYSGTAALREWTVEAREFAAPLLTREPRQRGITPIFWGFAMACGILAVLTIVFPRVNKATKYARVMEEQAQRSKLRLSLNDSTSVRDVLNQQDLESDRGKAAPLVAHTARIALVAKDVGAIQKEVEEILKRHRGYIGQMNVNAPTGSEESLEATLRIPESELEAALAEIRALGRVESETRAGEDVTQQSVDLDARLANARNTEQRLTELLRQRTGRLSDVLQVETRVDSTRGEIERMEAARKNLSSRVAFASVDVHVTKEPRAALDGGHVSRLSRLWDAAADGLRTVGETLFSMLTFLLSSGPSLALWGGILLTVGRAVWRRFGDFGLSYWKDDGRAGIPESRR